MEIKIIVCILLNYLQPPYVFEIFWLDGGLWVFLVSHIWKAAVHSCSYLSTKWQASNYNDMTPDLGFTSISADKLGHIMKTKAHDCQIGFVPCQHRNKWRWDKLELISVIVR